MRFTIFLLIIFLRFINQLQNQIMNSRQQPLNPREMLQRLMVGNFKQSECIDQANNIEAQREILIQLNAEYEIQITQAKKHLYQEQQLYIIKEDLISALEDLRRKNQIIQMQTFQSVQVLRTTPLNMKEQSLFSAQINEVRGVNNKLRIRIKDMKNYLENLEKQNQRLEQERHIISQKQFRKRQVDKSWRTRINLLKHQPLSYQKILRDRNINEQNLIKLQAQKSQNWEPRRSNQFNIQNNGNYPIDQMNSSNVYSHYRYI